MKEGDKFIHTDRFGNKHELTYSGTRREIKGCEFEFFMKLARKDVVSLQIVK